MHERLTAIVTGKVQGVMYRDFVERKARRLKLAGEVRNLPDGTVRVIAEGPRPALAALLRELRAGPLFARVDAVAHAWLPAEGAYEGFAIRYADD